MRFDFLTEDSWDQVNDKAREKLTGAVAAGLEFEARCYGGLAAGLLEVFSGTASFLSHKRTLGVVTGQSWVQEAVLPYLLRENFTIKSFTVEQMRDSAAVLAQLEGETSCFLWPEDHPVTAELFDGEELEEALAKKRIFSIRLSHHAYRLRPAALRPYSVRLCSVREDLAVGLLGARFKTPPWIAPLRSWNTDLIARQLDSALTGAIEDRAAVQAFEKGAGVGWRPLLQTESRLWDRALLVHPDLSGDEAMHELKGYLGAEWPRPGERSKAETLHLCRWEATMKSLDWWAGRPSPETVRGLVALDAAWLSDPRVRAFFGVKST